MKTGEKLSASGRRQGTYNKKKLKLESVGKMRVRSNLGQSGWAWLQASFLPSSYCCPALGCME